MASTLNSIFPKSSNKSMSNPHVALLPNPAMGHITPFLELAKRLVIHHGLHVSFLVINTDETSTARDHLLRPSNLPLGLDIVHLPLIDVSAIASPSDMILTRLCTTIDASLVSLKSVIELLSDNDNKPKALIVDMFCTQAFDVGKELSIPTYVFFTCSTSVLAFSVYLPILDREVEGEFTNNEFVNVPGCCPIRTQDLLEPVKSRKIDEYKWFLFHASRFNRANGILVNSWNDLERVPLEALSNNPFYKEIISTPPVHLVGPLIKRDDRDDHASNDDGYILEWLDKQPPDSVLYVALGSGGALSSEQLIELAHGLESSQRRFILVVRVPTDKCFSETFFSPGSEGNDPKAYLPEGFVERTRGRGLVVSTWAPQVRVLGHPSTGGFLSHCGWNSALESVSYGVPMIAWPLYAEQRMNAALLVEEARVAIRPVEGVVVGREEIERVVRSMMEGEEGEAVRKRARELRETADKALGAGGSSCHSVARLTEEWKTEYEHGDRL